MAVAAGHGTPFIIEYNASSVPILQLGFSGQGLNEQQLNDLSTQTIRVRLATIEGAQEPYPYGDNQREIIVDLNQQEFEVSALGGGWDVTQLPK